MNRDIFFQHARREPFSGRMTPSQVAGINSLLDAWNDALDVRWLAYVLATVFHETGARMQPVREGFAKSDAQARRILAKYPYAQPDPVTGHAYYGRGHVQLTWAKNYKAMGEALGANLYYKPDMALEPLMSARILMTGMINGLFTGKKLADYFNARKDDPVGARRIVNDTDRAALIAGYHHAFLSAISAAVSGVTQPEPEAERETPAPRYPEEVKPLSQSRTMAGQGIAGIGTAGATAVETVGDTLTQAQDVAGQLSMYLDVAKWLFIALVVAGIAWTVWARYDDHRKQIR